VIGAGGTLSSGPVQLALAAVSCDVRQAFAGVGASALGLGLGLGSGSYPRPSTSMAPGAGLSLDLPPSPRRGVSRDLLEATDYITGAVTSLVKELHSGQRHALGTITITITIMG